MALIWEPVPNIAGARTLMHGTWVFINAEQHGLTALFNPCMHADGFIGRRMLLNAVTESVQFKWIIIAFAGTGTALLLGLIALIIFCTCRKKNIKVAPMDPSKVGDL